MIPAFRYDSLRGLIGPSVAVVGVRGPIQVKALATGFGQELRSNALVIAVWIRLSMAAKSLRCNGRHTKKSSARSVPVDASSG